MTFGIARRPCNRRAGTRIFSAMGSPPMPRRTIMRCLQHVLWRGVIALGLLAFAGTGALLLP